MSNFRATTDGDVPFTASEEIAWAVEHATWESGARDRKAAQVRAERNAKIAACDWRMLSDSPINETFKFYRQALRDIPQQPGFPDNVVWPDEP